MKIASWNVNSLNVRLPHLEQWLKDFGPDIVGIQETKLEDHKFPDSALIGAGYRSVFAGQKTYNGVALLSREPAQDVQIGIPGFEDEQKRVIAGTFGDLRVINLYVSTARTSAPTSTSTSCAGWKRCTAGSRRSCSATRS